MQAENLTLISVDDHVIEPPDMFEGRFPAKYADQAPRIVDRDDGSQMWMYAGIPRPQIGINAVAGRPREEYGLEPAAYSEMRVGTYDVHERVKDMSAGGVLASMCFPSFARFCGQFFAEAADKDFAAATVRAYNDWHIDAWAGEHPDRFIPLAIPMVWDAELSAVEMRRVAAKGCRAVTFSENPHMLGLPSFHTDYWDPFFRACADEGIVVCMHIGSSSQTPITAPEAPIDVSFTLSPISIVSAAADVLFSPLLTRFPELRFALSEGGIGWVPYFLERVDWVYERHHYWTGTDFGSRKPSELFHERFLTCFVDDAFGVESIHHLNTKNVMWECDYPHSDTIWPDAPEILAERFAGFDDELVADVTHRNAMRHFGFDPFAHRPPERCTVGALRSEVSGHDTSIVSRGKREAAGAVNLGAMAERYRPKAPTG